VFPALVVLLVAMMILFFFWGLAGLTWSFP
jgi:hypothetical protein